MPEIADWLQKLGLGQYAQRFAENAITFAILSDLTDQDLKEIGVSALGHRRVLLRAIAALGGGENDAAKPSAAAATPAVPHAHDAAERRQVTVMFSDLVGSTALSARMDPEDLRELISAYQKCVADTVRRFGGYVAKYMGDGVLIYFGYPQAHEDDAERAVRAGLELIAAVAALTAGPLIPAKAGIQAERAENAVESAGSPLSRGRADDGFRSQSPVALQTRVGIATGLVVVGELIGSGEAQERGIVGETPNLAARLQGLAEPNMVVIAESTRRLIGKLFELEDLGAQDLRGIAGQVPAWAVLRASSVESRFEALHGGGLTALVGREEECELLRRRWSRAKSGEGQVVLLSGEAGIGKSRLTAALFESIAAEPHTRLRYFCSPQATDSALYPIIGQMERAAGLAREDSLQTKLDKLDKVLALASTSPEDAALFAEMLSLPNDGRYPALQLTPQQRRQKTLEALVLQVVAFARQNPVLIVFEDAHWTDPTSLEALGRTVDRIASHRVLVIVTFRPDFQPPWLGRPYVTALILNRLPQRDIDLMIDRVVGNKLIPVRIRQDIIDRTDGIPLFVEEMTKAVLEAGSEVAAEQAVSMVPSPAVAVPPSLHASLMARLDRLGSAKEVAQIAAAIGREFSYALLASVVRKPEAELEGALDRLVGAGLLFRQGMPPHATYLFKHALVQDAAYGTLLREPRRALHARIADALERQFADIAENQPELLARHCTEAGQIEKAAALWGKAGQRSLARSALVEAVEQLTRALSQIAELPATPALRREQIKLQVALITPLIHVKGYAASETNAAVERARLLIEQAEAAGEPPEDPLLLFSVLYGSLIANYVAINGDVLRNLTAQFLALAEKQAATAPPMVGHRLMGIALLCTGDIAQSRKYFDRALALYDPAEHRPLATRFSVDSGMSTLCYRSWALWMLGYPEAALTDANHALKDARDIDHVATLMYALFHTSLSHMFRGNYSAAKMLIEELIRLAEEKGSPFWKAGGIMNQGCVSALTGKPSDAVQTITTGISVFRSTGATIFIPMWSCHLAAAYADLGQFEDAQRCISEAMVAVQATKETLFEAELCRIAGEITLMSPQADVTGAEANFERALAVARSQQAKSWELRAATSMARLLRDQGKHEEARELLAPVYGWFTEGFDTLDLKEAKALLDALAH